MNYPTLLLLAVLFPLSFAATVTYDFNITWVLANPDNAFVRPVVGINGQWPLPHITATVNDTIVVNVINQLGNETSSLHFHGIYMNGTTDMDGPVGTTQCAILPGGSFTYNFTVSRMAFEEEEELQAEKPRSNNLVHTGTIRTRGLNIRMVSGPL